MDNKILILSAHPDDEILGCGGVIQKHKEENDQISVCIVTDGSSSQYPGEEEIANRKITETQKVKQFLKIDNYFYLDFPDMKLDSIAHLDINKEISNIVSKIKPQIIYTHSPTDLNMDHRQVYYSTEVVTRPLNNYLKKVYTYETLSSTEWRKEQAFIPNTFVNIEPYIDKKIKALSFYESETRDYPHPRSLKGIEILAQYRGLQTGLEFAESFRLITNYD
jgi:LmbE family N-acetylglucosaminyl deacetylase